MQLGTGSATGNAAVHISLNVAVMHQLHALATTVSVFRFRKRVTPSDNPWFYVFINGE